MQGFPKSEKTIVGISRFALTKSWNFRIRFLEISVIPGCGLEIDVDMIQGRGVRVPRFLSQHIGIPTFQCKGVEIPSLYTGTMYIGTPGSEQVVSGIPNSNPMVSGIPNLDLRIPESKSGIPATIPEVVQHCLPYGEHRFFGITIRLFFFFI